MLSQLQNSLYGEIRKIAEVDVAVVAGNYINNSYYL